MKFLFFLSLFFVFASFNACEKVKPTEMDFRPEYIEEGNYTTPAGDSVTVSYVIGQKSQVQITKTEGENVSKQIRISYNNIGTSKDCIFYCYDYTSGFNMAQYGGEITVNSEGFIFDCAEEITEGFMLLQQSKNKFTKQ